MKPLSPRNQDVANEEVSSRPRQPERFGPYEVLGEIAQGGMGIVYKARNTKLGQVVALKVLLAGKMASEGEVKRFVREARALGRINHPAVVKIHGCGGSKGHQYFAMEYIDGPTLSQLIRHRKLTPRESARIVLEVAEALEHVHREDILHRDLKPSNIMLRKDGSAVIADFGLARDFSGDSGKSKLTQSGVLMGTLAYMAPEQAEGKSRKLDACTDVYSLGAVLYECLTGRPPFSSDNQFALIMKVMEKDPIPARKLKPKIPPDLEIIAMKCLEKKPERRYRSMGGLAYDLRAYLEDRPIRGTPPSVWTRSVKFARRNRLQVGAAVVAGLSLVLALSFMAWRQQVAAEAEMKTRNLALKAAQDAAEKMRRAKDETRRAHEKEREAERRALEKAQEAERSKKLLAGTVRKTISHQASPKEETNVKAPAYMPPAVADPPESTGVFLPKASAAAEAGKQSAAPPRTAQPATRPPPDKPVKAPAVVPKPARKAAAPSKGSWAQAINLLPLAKLPQSFRGKWIREKAGTVLSDSSAPALLELPYEPPEEYDLRVEFTLVSGNNAVGIVLQHEGQDFTWMMGAWDNTVMGLENVGGRGCNGNRTTLAGRLQPGKRYVAEVRVRRNKVTTFLDGAPKSTWQPAFGKLGPPHPHWRLGNRKVLGLASYRTWYRFHRVLVKEVTGKGNILQPNAVPGASATEKAKGKIRFINFLKIIDPARDTHRGRWKLDPSGVLSSDGRDYALLELPYIPPEEYDFVVRFSRRSGDGAVAQFLSKSGKGFGWYMGAYANTKLLFEWVKGSKSSHGLSLTRKNIIQNKQVYLSRIEVRKKSVKAYVNNQLIEAWTPKHGALSPDRIWAPKDVRQLAVGSQRSPTNFYQIAVREVSGRGRFIRIAR